jgi:inorganic pyrophosphatase
MMTMIDQGKPDHKIISVLCDDPIYNEFRTAAHFPKHIFRMLRRFFEDYKQLEGKEVLVDEIQPAEEAWRVIDKSLAAYSSARRKGNMPGL